MEAYKVLPLWVKVDHEVIGTKEFLIFLRAPEL